MEFMLGRMLCEKNTKTINDYQKKINKILIKFDFSVLALENSDLLKMIKIFL